MLKPNPKGQRAPKAAAAEATAKLLDSHIISHPRSGLQNLGPGQQFGPGQPAKSHPQNKTQQCPQAESHFQSQATEGSMQGQCPMTGQIRQPIVQIKLRGAVLSAT